jgi:hypothetical protein
VRGLGGAEAPGPVDLARVRALRVARHDLTSIKHRLKALEAKVALNGVLSSRPKPTGKRIASSRANVPAVAAPRIPFLSRHLKERRPTGIDNGEMVVLIPSFCSPEPASTRFCNASKRACRSVLHGIAAERSLIPLEDRSEFEPTRADISRLLSQTYDEKAGDPGELRSTSQAAEIA